MLSFPFSRLALGAMLLLCQTPLLMTAVAQAASEASSPAPPVKRWVTLDFPGSNQSGEVQTGKPLELLMTVGGIPQSSLPLLAICESVYFQRQSVTLQPDTSSMTMKATAILEPIPPGKLSVSPKVARIQITLGRAREENKFERIMSRAVYVTLGKPELSSDASIPQPLSKQELGDADLAPDHDEVQPNVAPLATGPVIEEELVPTSPQNRPRSYWQQVSYLVNKSWSRTISRARHSTSSETVGVRFRLYPGGRAQLIQIEKGSGAREIDEAGISAIVQAQPFPPFPNHLGPEPVTVHIHMRTSPKHDSQQSRPATNSQAPDPTLGMPKK